MKNWIKEEIPLLHNLLNEDTHDFGTHNAHGFPKTGRHLAQDFENQNWPCQARRPDKFLNETAKHKEWESAQTRNKSIALCLSWAICVPCRHVLNFLKSQQSRNELRSPTRINYSRTYNVLEGPPVILKRAVDGRKPQMKYILGENYYN